MKNLSYGGIGMKKRMFVLVVLLVLVYIGSKNESEFVTSEELKGKLLRYHVVANSDGEVDQQVKLKVKEAVLAKLEEPLKEAESSDGAKEIIEQNLSMITNVANSILEEENAGYKAKVRIGEQYFPTKIYGDLTLPPGEYEALIIELGRAQGKNWWCVLFPTLCFIEPDYGVLPEESKEKLAKILTTEEYYAVMSEDNTEVKVESKVINWVKQILSEE